MCFVDDIVLASDSADEHLDQLDEFLTVVEHSGLTLKLSKCWFGMAELPFLGMIISEHGMRPNPEKIAAIVNTPVPTTITAMKSFLGAVNYQRRYIPNCATILRPLYEISSGERLGEWGPAQQEAFDTAKKLLTTTPILASPRVGVGYILETDASKKGLGYVLLQPDKEGNNRVVAYGSRKTTKFEEKKDPCVLEAAAVRWSLEQCAPYLIGNPTTVVRTDNTAVTALLTKEDRNLTSQMNKYRLAIQAYPIRLEHRSGKTNKMADYLSRYVPEEPTATVTTPDAKPSTPPADAGQVNAITSDALRLTSSRIRAEQRRETKLRQFYETLSGAKPSSRYALTAKDKTTLSKCSLRDGVICYQATADTAPRIWLPEKLREQAIRELHEDPLAGGHLGTNKVEQKVRQRFYWPNLHDDVSAIVSSCPSCQFRKAPTKITPTEPLSKWPTPRWPFDRIHLDLYGVLPLTKKRHRYVLTVADALTKWICAIPLKGQTAQEVHDAFLNNVIAKYGICSSAITDQGTQFICKPFDQLASLYGFRHIPVSAHHQSSNGQIERFHKTLADMLSSYVSVDPTSWDDYLASITMAYNCSVHAITGQSPFWSLYGREPNLPLDLRITLFQEQQHRGEDGGIGENRGQDGAVREPTDQEAELAQTERLRILRRAWKDMRKTIEDKGTIRDAYRDDRVRAKAHQLKEGQLVLKRKPAEEVRSKFDYRFDGPYRLRSINPPNVTIQKLHENAKQLTLHVDQVKPFKAAITLPIYSDCRDAPLDAEGERLDALLNGEHAEASSEEEREATAGDEVNAVRILPPSPHPITINENGYWKDVRDNRGHVLIFNANALEGRARICALNLDGTIIKTRSGATFPKHKDDWQFWNETVPEKLRRMHHCDFKVCVFSNQFGLSNGAADLQALKSKIEDVCDAIAVPMQFFVAVSDGFYRKPNIGMWRLLEESENDYEEVSKEHSFYVGNAAGRPASANRPADHANSDELFAANAGIEFVTPEVLFREKSYTQYSAQRQEKLNRVDAKRQSVNAVHRLKVSAEAREERSPCHVSENAGGGHSGETSSPLTGDDLTELMKLLDRVEEKLIREGDAQLDGSGSDSDSGIDSTLIRTLGGASFHGRNLRHGENLPRKVPVKLEQEILSRLRKLECSGLIGPTRRALTEPNNRAHAKHSRHHASSSP
ncbi:pol polyprotein [Aphelenchoides avenae]|nr:pol polyprotein [Aphelenchus avenae]